MKKTLLALLTVAFVTLASSSAFAAIIFESSAANGTTTRGAGSSIMTRFEVSADTTITAIGIEMDLVSAGNLNFVIFDSLTGSLLYQSGAQAFSDDGMNYNVSNPFSFTLLAGTRYALGATADVGSVQTYVVPGGRTEGTITSLGRNQNAFGFINPTLDMNLNSTDGRVRLFGEIAQAPEPASMLLFGAGLLGLGMRRLRQKRA